MTSNASTAPARWRLRYGPPTMWARHAARLVAAMVALGADRAAVLRAAGLADADLADADGRVPLEAVYEAIESAVAQTGDLLLGVHVAQRVTVEDLDAMGFLLLTSRTMRDAIERMNRYADVFVSGERYRWFVDEKGVHHEFVPYGRDRGAHRQVTELCFYDVARRSPALFGPDLRPCEIRFAHPPTSGVDYDELFGVPVRFEQPHHEALFPEGLLDVELAGAHSVMAGLVDRYLDGLLGHLPTEGSLVARVADIVDRSLESGVPSLAAVAAETATSPRSLQRQLRAEGTSLSALVDAARRSRALLLVGAGVPTVEVAYLLGYADQAAFHRAFRRWTGTTPSAHRRTLR